MIDAGVQAEIHRFSAQAHFLVVSPLTHQELHVVEPELAFSTQLVEAEMIIG